MAQLKDTTVDGTLTADTLSATTIQENGTNLEDKYNAKLKLIKNQSPSDTIETSNNTWTKLMDFSLEAGIYLVIVTGGFSNNSSGIRYVGISDASGRNHNENRFNTVTFPPVNGDTVKNSFPIILTPTSTTTYYVNVKQTSVTKLNAYVGYSVVKLA